MKEEERSPQLDGFIKNIIMENFIAHIMYIANFFFCNSLLLDQNNFSRNKLKQLLPKAIMSKWVLCNNICDNYIPYSLPTHCQIIRWIHAYTVHYITWVKF